MSGKRDEALKVLAELVELSKRKFVRSYEIAMVYLGLGDKDQAFTWLDKAYQERDQQMVLLKVSPSWDPLRDDPRFQDLLRRMNFPE